MWTDTTRALHARRGLILPSDLTDAEWSVLEPLLPPASHVGRPRKWPMQERAGLPRLRRPDPFNHFQAGPPLTVRPFSCLRIGGFRPSCSHTRAGLGSAGQETRGGWTQCLIRN